VEYFISARRQYPCTSNPEVYPGDNKAATAWILAGIEKRRRRVSEKDDTLRKPRRRDGMNDTPPGG